MSKRPDEVKLWHAVRAGETPRAAGARLGVHPKRVRRLCEKWARKGIYGYATSVDTGWVNEWRVPEKWEIVRDEDGGLRYQLTALATTRKAELR